MNNFRKTAEAFELGKIPVRDRDDAMAWAAFSRGLRVLSADEVHRIKIPMAIVIGADDAFMADAQRLARAVPTTKVVVIPGTNHDTAISHPQFAEAVLAFLVEQQRVGQ
jgi:pimeloyl-ACP methyl ester carboxylesterase